MSATPEPARPGPAITVKDYKAADRAIAMEESRRGFATHAMTYALATAVMVAANLVFAPYYLWSAFSLLFWGVGLLMHYVFGVRRIGHEVTKRQASVERRTARKPVA